MSHEKCSKIMVACWVIVVSLAGVCLGEEESDPPPVAIGATCTQGVQGYLWTTTERSRWSIIDLCAVPTQFQSVESWPQSEEFEEALNAALVLPGTPMSYSAACVDVWSEFTQGRARVMLKVGRTIARTMRTVECRDGFWEIATENQVNVADETDYLLVGNEDGYDVLATNAQDLATQMQQALDLLNSQPGAQTAPFDRWFQTGSPNE